MNVSVFNYRDGFRFALVSFEKHLDYIQVAEELYNSYRTDLELVNALIVRPPVERPIQNLEEERGKISMLLERFPSLEIRLLGSNRFLHFLSENLNASLGEQNFPLDTGEFLSFCRQHEMEEFVLQSNAIIRAPVGSVLRTPSQEYTHAFLRVGNIQQRRHVLDVIFFWLLPKLKNAGAILTDSWSISSISLNIGRLYARYIHHLDPHTRDDNFHVNYLSAYYHGRREMGLETRQAFLPLLYDNEKRIIFLVSAVKTRRSLALLRSEVERQGYLAKMDIVALFGLQASPVIDVLCNLDNSEFLRSAQLTSGFTSYPDPPRDNSVVVIDDRTFMPIDPKAREIPLKKELSSESQLFFDRYLGLDAITVHRDAYFSNGTPQRHHGIFIDITRILNHPDFKAVLRGKISALAKQPDLIIFPPHDQGKVFVDLINELIADRFGRTVSILCFADIGEFAPVARDEIRDLLKGLPEDALILIADDVLTTGNRLRNYQKLMRELPYKGTIFYLVGVARTQLQSYFRSLKHELEYIDGNSTHKLEYIEQVNLPDWNKDQCPWCREAQFLDDLAGRGGWEPSVLRMLAGRQNTLVGATRVGLTNDAFHSVNKQPKAVFAGKSIFCQKPGISEAELVVRVAAGIHHAKTIGLDMQGIKVKLGVEYPLYTIIKSSQYLGDTFNDALIKAAIFRSCGSQEMYAIEDKLLQEQKSLILQLMADGKFGNAERCFFIYELFLALTALKLPEPRLEKDWPQVFSELLFQIPDEGKPSYWYDRAKQSINLFVRRVRLAVLRWWGK